MKTECGTSTFMSVGQLNYSLEKMEKIPFSLNFKFQKFMTSFNLVYRAPERIFFQHYKRKHVWEY